MKLAMFEKNGIVGLAAAENNEFHGFTAGEPGWPGDLDSLLTAGADLTGIGQALLKGPVVDMDKIRWLPPLSRPGKIVCLGLNYKAHSEEFGFKPPSYPELFARFRTTLTGHLSPIVKPKVSDDLDYEGELAMIIGKGGREISRDKALEHVAAYSVFNDASVRDYQMRGTQWLPGKNFDATGGFGPWLVTAGSLPAGAKGLRLTTRLNGQVMQDAPTSDMIFDVAEQIVIISQVMTLEPGDMIITGTPGGVGKTRNPQVFMKDGDECEIEIEGIGTLRNPVVAA
ncbi:fumarylacetoacetate hydrolase family protein [Deltaproteobacteria bacterium OttesenSCG-928-M10]|nr:fumarylacetoacetate hydrolase family protein [Deltaproteobacteria bacterium OttesenSCG-928-M10]